MTDGFRCTLCDPNAEKSPRRLEIAGPHKVEYELLDVIARCFNQTLHGCIDSALEVELPHRLSTCRMVGTLFIPHVLVEI